MPKSCGNVLYLCVAQKDGSKVAIVASYSHEVVTDEAAVLTVLQRSELQIVAGRQYNFACSQNGWHLIAGKVLSELQTYALLKRALIIIIP